MGGNPGYRMITRNVIQHGADRMTEDIGVIVAALTPRGKKGDLDFGAAFELIDRLCAAGVRGIALFTESGATARKLSKYHPSAPIFALSPVEVTINRLNLLWGTTPIRCPKVNSTEALVDCAENLLLQSGYVKPREVIAIVAGTRTKSGSTNFLRLHVLGEHQDGVRFFAPREEETLPDPAPETKATKPKRPTPKPAKPPAPTI